MSFSRQTAPAVILATLAVAMFDYVRMWDVIGVIGNFTLHVSDVLFAVTLIYCIAWALQRWRYSPLEYVNLLLCGIIALNFARGMAAVGVAHAGVTFRTFSGFVVSSLFVFLMHQRISIDWVLDKVVLLGWGLVLLSVARLTVGLNAFLSPEMIASNPLLAGLSRTLNSSGALMLGEATLIVLSRVGALPAGPKRRRMGAIFLVFVAAVLISGQRTATFATLAGIGAVVSAFPPQRRRVVLTAGSFVIVIAGAAAYGAWIAGGGDITPFLPEAVTVLESQFNSEDSTYQWRLLQWQDSLAVYQHADLVHQIIGMPLGLIQSIGFAEQIETVQYSAHSAYIELLINSGIVGVVLFVSMLLVALTKGIMVLTRRIYDNSRSNTIGLAVAIIVSYMVYSYAYMIPNEHGLLLAIALQIIATAPGFARGTALSRRKTLSSRTVKLRSGVGGAAPVSSRVVTSDP
jgi:hypothetical protein